MSTVDLAALAALFTVGGLLVGVGLGMILRGRS